MNKTKTRVPAFNADAVPQRVQALVADAERQLAGGQLVSGGTLLRQALSLDPHHPAAHHLMGIACVLQQDAQAAVHHARIAAQLQPQRAPHWFTLGRAHKLADRLDLAADAYRRAIECDPAYPEARVSLGIVLLAQGDCDAAIEQHRQALALRPDFAAAHANLAKAMAVRIERELQRGVDEVPSEEAIAAAQQAVDLDPRNTALLRNLGKLLMNAQRRIEAADLFQRVLSIDIGDVESCLSLGECLRSVNDQELSRELYDKWIAANPANAPVMRAYCSWLSRQGEVDAALQWGHKALALDNDPGTMVLLGGALMQARRMEDSMAMGRRAIDASGRNPNFYPATLLGCNYIWEDARQVFDLHLEYGSRLPVRESPRPAWRPLAEGERLRVGFVTGDFAAHSVAAFTEALLARLDRERFETFVYYSRTSKDAITQRFIAQGHHWFDCDGVSDAALARRIEKDGIDILLDLSGHTEATRTPLFALAPAPVQMSYLGYPTITGVPATDFRITDVEIDPGDLPPLPSEHPLALPRTMFNFRPDDNAPDIGPCPSLRNGGITFGSFNNIAKVTDATLGLWARAMNAVPGSRLLLKSRAMAQPGNREAIEAVMARHGISPERLTLTAWVNHKGGHLDLYNDVDIALDPYPYNGATTTCEALWMGVPVVTRRGATHTSRMGASILRAAGRGDCVADDPEGFAAIAARLAADEAGRAAWRAEGRDRLRASGLLDEATFATEFADVLLRAWALAGERAVQPAAA